MAEAVFRAAEEGCPRAGPGRPPDYSDTQMALLIMAAILKKKKSKSSQYRFLEKRRSDLMRWLDMRAWPVRSTYFARYARAHRFLEQAVAVQGRRALDEAVSDARQVAADKTMIAACGPPWHRWDQRRGVVPEGSHGLDRQAGWGRSRHDGWVFGYGGLVVVTAAKGRPVLPLLACAGTAALNEHRAFAPQVPRLPPRARAVLLDSGFDSNALADAIELDQEGRPTGRRCVCPCQPRAHAPIPGRTACRGNRERARQRRIARYAFYRSAYGRRLYARRRKSVEPFFEWLKSLFELTERVWHRGLGNNQTLLLAAVFAYQLLLRYNHKHHRDNGQVQWILDSL
jgi:hypothetical protein